MKKQLNITVMALALLSAFESRGQGFDPGSNGSYGPLNVTADTNLQLPPDGIFHCTTINVAADATLSFTRNALNTPVYLLAKGDVVIDGKIDVSGAAPFTPYAGGIGGPGGFDGGAAGLSQPDATIPGGDGQGPGAGKHADGNYSTGAGAGSYGTLSQQAPNWANMHVGPIYGTAPLIPIIGGSGGGGVDGDRDGGGGGGGGALLIGSGTKITLNPSGILVSHGGAGSVNPFRTYENAGSGGAIRLVAPRVYGTGTVDVQTPGLSFAPGAGRIRIDSIFKYEPTDLSLNLDLKYIPVTVASVGSTMIVFPPNAPRLDITQAAGNSIAEGTPSAVRIQLPFGTDPNQNVTVQAKNFKAKVPIRVVLTPPSGDAINYDAEVDNTTANPATATVNVKFPINQLVQVSAWTK